MTKFECRCGELLDHPDDDKRFKCGKCRRTWDVVWHSDNHAELREIQLKDRAKEAYQHSVPVTKFIIAAVIIDVAILALAKVLGLV